MKDLEEKINAIHTNPIMVRLTEVWKSQYKTLEKGTKEEIRNAFFKYVQGYDGKSVEDYSSFWNKVDQITPNIYSKSDIDWLATGAEYIGAGKMMYYIDGIDQIFKQK